MSYVFEWDKLLIICPLVFLSGFVDSIAGGGGLISLPAHLIAGLPAHLAMGTNKLSASLGTLLTTIRFARRGYIPYKLAAFCVVCALIGSAAGARATLMLSDHTLKILMLVILPLTALRLAKNSGLAEEKEPFGPLRTVIISMTIAFLLGIYDGFYGPGAGTFMLLLLAECAHLPLKQANGTAKAINLATNIAALAVFLVNSKVLIPLGLTAALFSIAGNYAGSRMFEGNGARIVRPIMLTVLALFFVRVLSEMFF